MRIHEMAGDLGDQALRACSEILVVEELVRAESVANRTLLALARDASASVAPKLAVFGSAVVVPVEVRRGEVLEEVEFDLHRRVLSRSRVRVVREGLNVFGPEVASPLAAWVSSVEVVGLRVPHAECPIEVGPVDADALRRGERDGVPKMDGEFGARRRQQRPKTQFDALALLTNLDHPQCLRDRSAAYFRMEGEQASEDEGAALVRGANPEGKYVGSGVE
jgi:hypothetical protein